IRYPIEPDGYVHTWDGMIGWPFPANPPYDTRHFDSNARFILACWRYYLWTGDRTFLQSQAERLRRSMRYQLEVLHGTDGLIVTASKDVTGRHGGLGDNYWDILPFGHLDAYVNAVFYASLEAMAGIQKSLGEPSLVDYTALRKKVHEQYDATFWDEGAGRFIGCVDVDGKRHDYGFTFVNLEALYYGLGDREKARRIYHWMESEPTSTGKADTYSQWIFAPRANTIHNPQWDEKGSKERGAVRPWWAAGWRGTPYGDQCQDGGAILYTSYFDLMVRLRYFGVENAWKRFKEIMDRYGLPDRLCGGSPLFRGEIPQQDSPGSVGLDLPFPESGLVPCFFLYGILGVQPETDGLHINPQLPHALSTAGVHSVDWNGKRIAIDVRGGKVRVVETTAGGPGRVMALKMDRGGGGILELH
ncbi:MAG: glycoside hydrolase family 116 protein, partial [Armatimonadota bacterium]|nr:glycoside hydrolase family 116 protein [Armatimonadota bacterium]